MTVVNPKSISGINSITTGSGSDNLLTIHTNDGTERVRVDSTGTTKIVTGIVTTLTATGSAKVGSGVTLSPDGDVFTTGITTSSSVIVGGGVTISESDIEASGIGITCANINGTQIGGRRNLIINGAMEVAQRGTSSTGTTYGLDRMKQEHSGTDEAPTYAQVDVSSGTSPYTEGFRKALKITNGNQTSGAGSSDYVYWWTVLEAQNVAKSGWNYTSASSFITISFWIKSSVAQNFYGMLQTADGTSQGLAYETGSLTADTWTKIVKTIPGNSNLQFDNDNGPGFYWAPARAFDGTDRTASMSLDTWATYSGSSRTPDATSTWYTTNDATLEITGLQMEVGPQATAFEHRSFAEELTLCQRYYWKQDSPFTSATIFTTGAAYGTSNTYGMIFFPVPMRTGGSGISMGYSALSDFEWYENATSGTPTSFLTSDRLSTYGGQLFYNRNGNGTSGYASWLRSANTNAYISWDCEL
jgi:hypothetical protein